MSRNDRIKDRYPALFAYSGTHRFLGSDTTTETSFEDRIKSIWPFAVRRILRFAKTLKPRELSNYDPEDILSEIMLKLAEKDDKWSPERGKYITFVGVIMEHELQSIRDRARTVHAPRNSSSRLSQYSADTAAGTMSEQKSKTAADIRRTREGTFGLTSTPFIDSEQNYGTAHDDPIILADGSNEGPVEAAIRREAAALSCKALRLALRKLTALEALVICRLWGIGGSLPESIWFISWSTTRDITEIRGAKDRAMTKIRKHLADSPQPAVA